MTSWRSSITSLATLFSIPHPALTVVLLVLVHNLAMNVEVLLPQFTSLNLQWTLASSNDSAVALKSFLAALVLISLPTLRKRLLEPRLATAQIDLLIMAASTAACILGALGLGISTAPVTYIISVCLYTAGQGLADSMIAYGTTILGPTQTLSEYYVRTSLVQTIAAFLGGPLWSTFFALILRSRALPLGTPFVLCSLMFCVIMMGVKALHSWTEGAS